MVRRRVEPPPEEDTTRADLLVRLQQRERIDRLCQDSEAFRPITQPRPSPYAEKIRALQAGEPVVVQGLEIGRRAHSAGLNYRVEADGEVVPVVPRKVGVDIVGWDAVAAVAVGARLSPRRGSPDGG